MPATVRKGQAIATHKGLHCGCYGSGMTDHVHYQLEINGRSIDPAPYLFC
jgi:murein DD-endopeptidase MepM/ murein hydrolase activator NlpD